MKKVDLSYSDFLKKWTRKGNNLFSAFQPESELTPTHKSHHMKQGTATVKVLKQHFRDMTSLLILLNLLVFYMKKIFFHFFIRNIYEKVTF